MTTHRYRDQYGNILNLTPEDAHKRSHRAQSPLRLTKIDDRKILTDDEHAEAAANDTVDNKRSAELDKREAKIAKREAELKAQTEAKNKARSSTDNKTPAPSDPGTPNPDDPNPDDKK